MDRKQYNNCMASGLKGKNLTKDERAREFCVLAKICSGKAKDRDEAARICSQPKEKTGAAKTSKRGTRSSMSVKLSPAQILGVCPCARKEK